MTIDKLEALYTRVCEAVPEARIDFVESVACGDKKSLRFLSRTADSRGEVVESWVYVCPDTASAIILAH